MIKQKPYRLLIPLHIYPITVCIHIGMTTEESQDKMLKDGIPKDQLEIFPPNSYSWRPCVDRGYIFLKEEPNTPTSWAAFTHEVLHIILCTCSYVGLKVCPTGVADEAVCYLMSYITEETLRAILDGRKKEKLKKQKQ